MFKKIIFFSLFLGINTVYAQEKKALSHGDYDLWKSIENTQMSKNGNLIVTTISTSTGRGDGYMKIFNAKTGASFTFENAYRTTLSSDGNYVFFLRKPAYQQTRKEKKEEVKEEKMTKEDFFIFDVKNHRLLDSVSRVKNYEIPKETTGWVVIEKFKDLNPEKDTLKIKTQENLALKADYALVYNLKNKQTDSIFEIKDFKLPEQGNIFVFSTGREKEKGDYGVFSYDVQKMTKKAIDTGRYSYTKLAIDREGQQLAFLSAKDSIQSDSLKHELFYVKDEKLNQLTDTLGKNLRENWEISAAQNPYFSKNGKRLFFYSRPQRQIDRDTSLLDEEIPQLDVWSYHDELIQPEQKSRLKDLENKAFQSFYHPESGEITTLHDETLEYVIFDDDREQRFVLGYTSSPYDVERSWEYPWVKDYYIIDTKTGKKTLALEAVSNNPVLSPDGKYAVFYHPENKNWWSLDLQNNIQKNLTENLQVNFFDEENDVPALPSPYGFGGFTKDGKALLYDKFDIWSADLAKGKNTENVTKDGRDKNIEYRTLKLDREHRNAASYYNKGLLITGFEKDKKWQSLYTLNVKNGKKQSIVKNRDMILANVEKSEDGKTLLFRKQNFQHYPDLFLLKDPKAEAIKLTNVNPQQKEFKWGTVEKYSWTAYDGNALDGLLYKPEGFDPKKRYPLMVYFYEKNSDNLHRYHSPKPSASTVNMSYLVSNDYLVFVPDIVYKEGKPGESAYNAIVSGVEELEKEEFIDSKNMAIQGQSWGGYQVAHLVTVTNKFKAAMAGAPVSNMTSAYGGIRWQTGLSRAFQYEKTQSRIGKNLWEGFDLYIENSPLFGIPNIETPLLMMHNDADGAVPYYQGIEMFMGMRRLNKPVWLLVYNNEAHNLTKMKNKQDLSIRMMQFFDHYLKDEPAPEWMTQGLPAIMKGKDLRYDLDQKKKEKKKINISAN